VIDTETGFLQMGMARETAEALGGSYYSMDHLSEERLLRIVRRTEG
jgi:magnesium chelatase subunit D